MTRTDSTYFMRQLVSAVGQLCSRLPSLPCRVLAYRDSIPAGLSGSYVILSADRSEHIVGLLSHTLGWEALSQALDQDRPREESRGLVEGACELGKSIADAFGSRLLGAAPAVVGVPLFAEGRVSMGRRVELLAADVALGDTVVLLVLFSWTQDARPSLQGSESRVSGRAD